MTKTTHVALQGLGVALSTLTAFSGAVPASKQGYVVAGISVLQAILGLFNHGKKPKSADDPNEPPGAGN